MNILLTTVALTNDNYLFHRNCTEQHLLYDFDITKTVKATLTTLPILQAVSFSQTHLYYQEENIHAVCSYTCASSSPSSSAESTVRQYIQHVAAAKTHFQPDYSHCECILLDNNNSVMWISSDPIGSFPMWYSLSSQDINQDGLLDFVVTSDLLAAYHLGFTHLTALGPGQSMSVNLSTNEVISFSHYTARASSHVSDGERYAVALLSAGMAAVRAVTTETNPNGRHTTEQDALHSSSQLMDCVCDSLDVPRTVWRSRALVADVSVDHFPGDSHPLRNIIGPVLDLFDAPHSRTRSPSLLRTAVERWSLCSAAAFTKSVLLSYDTGFSARPVELYLQNTFCSLLNVTVSYPFALQEFQRALWSSQEYVTESYLQQAVQILRGRELCPSVSVDSERKFNLSRDLVVHSQESWSDRSAPSVSVDAEAVEVSTTGSMKPVGAGQVRFGASNRQFRALWTAFHGQKRCSGRVVLLLVTKGYLDLLRNFFAAALQQVSVECFLVVTGDEEVVLVAQELGAAHFMLGAHQTSAGADFGTLSYQRLILQRTECAMELLLMGHRPVVADIDTFWLRNPLSLLDLSESTSSAIASYDVAIIDDNDEVCGCFVALDQTDGAVRFWRTVLQRHRQLVLSAASSAKGDLEKFSDSEQKILTDLLYRRQYRGKLAVKTLSRSSFPSGLRFFNFHDHISCDVADGNGTVAVVHNNFLIGKEMKITRFQRYGLWIASSNDNRTHDPMYRWRQVFAQVVKNVSIPSLTIVLPVHGAVIDPGHTETHPMMLQVSREGDASDEAKLELWLDNNPPVKFDFDHSAIASISVHSRGSINAVVARIQRSNTEVSVDMGSDRSDFSATPFALQADEAVFMRARERPPALREVSESQALNIDSGARSGCDAFAESSSLNFVIKVLTHRRSKSLLRLLQSLAVADYCGLRNISLEILVDGERGEQEKREVDAAHEAALGFTWPHGPVSVVRREKNMGLAAQWLGAWVPTSADEVAFIFEDDVEVSPHYFIWASRAAHKYYELDSSQRKAHWALLSAVRGMVHQSPVYSNSSHSLLDIFAKQFAGEPVLFGVCLQRQHLDALHYPQRLNIRNGHRPFLYSLVGSWGPAMFPIAWQAFREWWQWRSGTTHNGEAFEPVTESTVVNHFWQSNKQNWTPWHVRFAHDVNLKCLYANLPGELALVTNHRESGENYRTALGPSSPLLSASMLGAAGLVHSSGDKQEKNVSHTEQLHVTSLRWSILFLPDLTFLSQWQFDLHVRRAGSLGRDGFLSAHLSSGGAESQKAMARLTEIVEWSNSCARDTEFVDHAVLLSASHWVLVNDVLEGHLLPGATVLHIGLSALLPMTAHQYLSHSVARLDSTCDCSQISARAPSVVCVHELADLAPKSTYSLLVIPLTLLSDQHGAELSVFMASLTPPQFILVVDALCSGAPTDISAYFAENGAGDQQEVRYEAVEDICAEGAKDSGAILFRLSVGSSNRFGVARRLPGGFVERRVVAKSAADAVT